MIVEFFLKWAQTARAAERAAAAASLARSFCGGTLTLDERCAAEAALTFLLDDPSAKVRAAMADALSLSPNAPRAVIAALAADQPDVAAPILGRSPLLTDGDLIERVASGSTATQKLIAERSFVSMSVSAALAEVGEGPAIEALLDNDCADIASLSFRRLAERFGHVASIRERLTADSRLPADCRHLLLVKLGQTLQASPFVAALMGERRAERVLREACLRSAMSLVEATPTDEHPALIEHLRLRGELTAGFVVRAVAHGRIDFFGAVLATLSGQSFERVRTLLRSGHRPSLAALFRRAALSSELDAILLSGLDAWRAVAANRSVAGAQEISFRMLAACGGLEAGSELARLLKSIHLDALRANARHHAEMLTAAA